ncbi:MAG TPA: hypothetical protein VL049_15560 [Candidatus Dormibacteraeota bacterium]|nr:hypothetical protein [Candidatus Dormibacteraeota bacterium]
MAGTADRRRGCIAVDYVGKSHLPTTSVEIHLSADEVKRAYETIGEARAQVGALPFANPGHVDVSSG